jgi:hypothetical protein
MESYRNMGWRLLMLQSEELGEHCPAAHLDVGLGKQGVAFGNTF